MTQNNIMVTLRTIAERSSRGIVLRRRLPARYGGDTLFVSPGALLKLWSPSLEHVDPELFEWAAEFISAGDVVWDIGANVGLFAFAAAGRAGTRGRVVAVEADIWLANLLRRSAGQPSKTRAPVDVLPVAVSGAVDIATFNIAERGRAANYLAEARGSSQAGGVRETQQVISVTLDWLLERFPKPNVVKIDVEGAELQVLSQATKLLATARPVILCEVRDHNAKPVTDLLHSHGYRLYDLAAYERIPVKLATFNTLALPPKKV
jgi:FkbM family methyltransferase